MPETLATLKRVPLLERFKAFAGFATTDTGMATMRPAATRGSTCFAGWRW